MSFSAHELAETIRRAREARGLTLKQLADQAGIGKTAMFDLEHGNPGVRLNTLLSVLSVLELDLQLLQPDTLTDPPPSAPTIWVESDEDLPDRLL